MLDEFCNDNLKKRKQDHLYRDIHTSFRTEGVRVERDGKEYISFCCNDYLGLSHHPALKQAAKEAADMYGVGAGASRLVTGSHPLYEQLETTIAVAKGTESARVFGSGYQTSLGVIPALVGRGDVIIADRLVHASLLDGARLSGARLVRFHHNDLSHCRAMLEAYRKDANKCLVITDTVFSMDGDLAPISQLLQIADEYDAWLLSDDAHGLGVLQPRTIIHPNYIQMGTLSKAIGCYGGYIAASQAVIDYLTNHARSLIYSTGLPPMVIASANKAFEIIQQEPALCQMPVMHARYVTEQLGMKKAASPIVPVILEEDNKAMDAAETLKEDGFLISAIRPPTVPVGTSRLRLTFSALHRKEDIQRLVDSLKKLFSSNLK